MTSDLFKWLHYEAEIILLNVRWHLKYNLSFRDLGEMMSERGLGVHHTTIFRWVKRYASELGRRIRPYLNPTNDSWRLDETYLKLHGEQVYLYRIVDSRGDTVDFLLSKTRDKRAARRPLRKALASRHNLMPRVINTDKYPATEIAIAEEIYMGNLDSTVQHRMCQYLNNIVEQDHWCIKRRTGPMRVQRSRARLRNPAIPRAMYRASSRGDRHMEP